MFYTFPFVSKEFVIDFCKHFGGICFKIKILSDNSNIWFTSMLTSAGFPFCSICPFLGCWFIFWIFCVRLWVIFYRVTLFHFIYMSLPAIQQPFQGSGRVVLVSWCICAALSPSGLCWCCLRGLEGFFSATRCMRERNVREFFWWCPLLPRFVCGS